MSNIVNNVGVKLVIRNLCTGRYLYKNHYETLKISRSSTQKEIRNAFISLSKKIHPDRNQGSDTHLKFVELSEAYRVLSKPENRYFYDLSLANPKNSYSRKNQPDYYKSNIIWKDSTFWEHRDKSRDKHYSEKSYYGIKGIRKLSNTWIVIFCVIFTSVGVGMQIAAIRNSITFKRDKLDKISEQNSAIHSEIREKALKNGNIIQLELLKQKLNRNVDYQKNSKKE